MTARRRKSWPQPTPKGARVLSAFARRLAISGVSALVVAGVAAQAVNLLAYPALTHFYTPADFGLFSVITSVSTFAGAIVLLRLETLYQIAPADEEEGLLTAAVLVALAMTVLTFLVALFFGGMLIAQVSYGFEGSNWHWSYALLIAGLAAANGILSLAREYGAKAGRYKRLAAAQVARTVLTIGAQLGLVFVLTTATSSALMAGFSLGLVISTLMIWPIRARTLQTLVETPRHALATTRRLLAQYATYVRIDVVNVLVRLSSLIAYPIFVLASFGVAETGLYAVASRITFIPIDVLAASISTVFFQKFAAAVRDGAGTARLYLVALAGAAAIAVAIAAALALVAGPLVDLVFGDGWARTAVIILYLLPTFLSRFVITCIGSAPLALKRPGILLWWNIVQLAIIAGTLVATRHQSLELFLLCSGLALLAASAVYAGVLHVTISRRPPVYSHTEAS
ncbi:lipopolysaccharide biosynthesis protein [Ancylobacter sp. TS-1]|uniref:lipopolysaccharide biosynthesis protein n=1 Tax=Ancylobacter sp. TS-1 TaxID=1850374 RepID=UPI001391296C|nr:oligosaccharide flippase family protein [Ancylobacter sp. TS-1]